MPLVPRDYQRRTVDDLYEYVSTVPEGVPCVELPTGAGKSVIIAMICQEALQSRPEIRILALTHVKELIAQNSAKMRELWPNAPVGIFSAGLRRKELGEAITFGGIQSLRGKADEIGHVDIIIIDECHLVGHSEEGGYRELIAQLKAKNPRVRIIGLTATPWRLGHGLITEQPAIFTDLLQSVTIEELIYRGYLSKLRSKRSVKRFDFSSARVGRDGDFDEKALAKIMDSQSSNDAVCSEIVALCDAESRRSCIIFCPGVEYAERISALLIEMGQKAAVVSGQTPSQQRANIIGSFKALRLRFLINVDVLSTGFDFPGIDAVVMLRATLSPVIYAQQVGRGLRLKEHTDYCLTLDFVGNIETHGPITNVRPPKKGRKRTGEGEPPVKTCDHCHEIVPASARVCTACGEPFPEPEAKPLILREDDIMGEDLKKSRPCLGWSVYRFVSKTSQKEMLRIDYILADTKDRVSEYLCLRHEGWAQKAAERTLAEICKATNISVDPSEPLESIATLLDRSQHPAEVIYEPQEKDSKFWRVKQRVWAAREAEPGEDEIPF